MLVLELPGDLNLAAESGAVDLGDELRREELDDDLSPECPVDRDERAAHSHSAELALDDVGTGQRVLKSLLEGCHAVVCVAAGEILRSNRPRDNAGARPILP